MSRHAGRHKDANETDGHIAIAVDLRHRILYNRIGSEARNAVPEEKNQDIRSVSKSSIPRTASQSSGAREDGGNPGNDGNGRYTVVLHNQDAAFLCVELWKTCGHLT